MTIALRSDMQYVPSPAAGVLDDAEQRLFADYDVRCSSRRVRLADPNLAVRVLETGAGHPVVLVHGSGMSAATWTPLLPHLADRRVHAVDLPGFGASDAYDYRFRSLRRHAVAQLESLLDVLGLERATIAGTSLGAMWALCLALDRPERVESVTALGIPAVALPGMRGNAFFRAMTTPGVRRLVAHAPVPKNARATRRATADVLGRHALDQLPDAYFDVVRATMTMPAWRVAMSSHLNLAMRSGRARPENVFTDDELRGIGAPVQFILGHADVYGDPVIGERAVALMPDARLEVLPGGHAPFLDDPARCADLIRRI